MAAGQLTIADPRRILILQLQQVGDTVVFSAALRAIRRRFPDARIAALVNPVSAQLLEPSPHLDELIVAPDWNRLRGGHRLLRMLPQLRAIRRMRFDCVIADVTEQSLAYAIIARVTGAPVRVGFASARASRLYTLRVPFRADAPFVLCNLDLARALGADAGDAREEVAISEAAADGATRLLAEGGLAAQRLAVVHPGSNWQSKTWYADRWAVVADDLARRGLAVVFVGTPGERDAVESARAAMTARSVSLVGRTTLPELAAVIARASLFVGTDSGPRNIAGALGVPNATVMSAQEDTDRWRGTREGETVLRANARCTGCYLAHCAHRLCMHAIEVGPVLEACAAALAADGPRPPREVRIPVPDRVYEAVAGTAAASCERLRTLAHAPESVARTLQSNLAALDGARGPEQVGER